MKNRSVIIAGAAGRDYHNFLTYYKNRPGYSVVCFTATQIPGIAGRRFPKKLAGAQYPRGIPIFPEKQLEKLIKKYHADEVCFSYSDVSHEYVMHLASRVLAAGADYVLLGPDSTMLSSKKPVISVCAVRTGSGKSQTTRFIARHLKDKGKKVAIIRHPMPYGDLAVEAVQRFARYEDLEKHHCTIEEREEYEHYIKHGIVVFAGVDYAAILKRAEKEADVILWDGGNNDFSFYRPDLSIVVADPHRAGHELHYHPGETNLRMADVIIINKVSTASPNNVAIIEQNVERTNPRAIVLKANSIVTMETTQKLRGKRALVVEDGPTLTHGGMEFGAGLIAARRAGVRIVDPRKHAVGSIKETFDKYRHVKKVLPAMGYGKKQVRELQETINRTPCDVVISGTPIDLAGILKTNKPVIRVTYKLEEREPGKLMRLVTRAIK